MLKSYRICLLTFLYSKIWFESEIIRALPKQERLLIDSWLNMNVNNSTWPLFRSNLIVLVLNWLNLVPLLKLISLQQYIKLLWQQQVLQLQHISQLHRKKRIWTFCSKNWSGCKKTSHVNKRKKFSMPKEASASAVKSLPSEYSNKKSVLEKKSRNWSAKLKIWVKWYNFFGGLVKKLFDTIIAWHLISKSKQ